MKNIPEEFSRTSSPKKEKTAAEILFVDTARRILEEIDDDPKMRAIRRLVSDERTPGGRKVEVQLFVAADPHFFLRAFEPAVIDDRMEDALKYMETAKILDHLVETRDAETLRAELLVALQNLEGVKS